MNGPKNKFNLNQKHSYKPVFINHLISLSAEAKKKAAEEKIRKETAEKEANKKSLEGNNG